MPALNRLIHEPVRLKITASLATLNNDMEVDFTFLQRQLKLTPGNLGAHIEKLEKAGYVKVRKTFVGRRPKTFLRLTVNGRHAYEDHIEALKEIIDT